MLKPEIMSVMERRNKGGERRVDRAGARVEVEVGVIIHRHHVVFGFGLRTFVGAIGVGFLEADQLALVERGEVVARGGAKVAAGAFDPENFDLLAGERVSLHDFGAGVAAPGIGDALIRAEFVGAINELVRRGKFRDLGVVPKVFNVLVNFLRHKTERIGCGLGGGSGNDFLDGRVGGDSRVFPKK